MWLIIVMKNLLLFLCIYWLCFVAKFFFRSRAMARESKTDLVLLWAEQAESFLFFCWWQYKSLPRNRISFWVFPFLSLESDLVNWNALSWYFVCKQNFCILMNVASVRGSRLSGALIRFARKTKKSHYKCHKPNSIAYFSSIMRLNEM